MNLDQTICQLANRAVDLGLCETGARAAARLSRAYRESPLQLDALIAASDEVFAREVGKDLFR